MRHNLKTQDGYLDQNILKSFKQKVTALLNHSR